MILNRIIDAQILQPTAAPRDQWALGTVSGTPSGGVAPVVIDGDSQPSGCAEAVACSDGDRVLTVLLGRSRIVVANLTTPAGAGGGGSMTPAQILAALVTVDGAGSGLDADLLDGSHASAFAAASHNHDSSYVKLGDYEDTDVLAKLLNVDGSGSGLDADLLDGQHGTYYAPETASTIGSLIAGATTKTTPVDADSLGLSDSAASNALKKLTWANVKAALKTYFDTLYAAVANGIDAGASWSPSFSCSGSMTISNISIEKAKHYHLGGLVLVDLAFSATLGGTASNGVRFTLPHATASGEKYAMHGNYRATNDYVTNTIPVDTTTAQILRADSTTNYVTGSGRYFTVQGWYRPAS